MAVTSIRIRRRAVGGAAGAPSSLKTAELAWNQQDGIFYAGKGDDGSGNATSIIAFAKEGYVDPSTLYQPLDADLTNFAGLDGTAGYIVKTGAGTHARRTLTGTANRVTVSNGDGTTGNPVFDLGQPTIGGSGAAAGITKVTVDVYGRVTNTGQASLSDLSVPTADMSMGGFKVTSLGTPTADTDAATKLYVDNAMFGIDSKVSARAATTGALPSATYATQTITGSANGALAAQDGVTLVVNEILLVKNEANAQRNGLYKLTQVGTGGTPYILTRTADMDAWAEVPGAMVTVEEGTTLADSVWISSANQGGTLGTTNITWVRIDAGAGGGFTTAGNGLTSSGATVDVVANNGIAAAADSIGLTGQALALHNATIAADQFLYGTGASTFGVAAFTSVARTLVAQTSQANMRTTGLGLGSMAVQDASAVAITGGTIDGVTIDGGTF